MKKEKKNRSFRRAIVVDLSLNPNLVDDTKVLEERYSNSQPSTQRSTLQIQGWSVVFILTWIKTTDKKYKQFVENRVSEIRQNSNVKDWEYKQEKENIAGLAFRGCNLKTLKCTKKWFNGPEWLLHDKEKWPTKDLGQNKDKYEKTDAEEIQRGEGSAAYFSEIGSKIKSKDFRIEKVIDLKRFSNFYKLHGITTYVLRFKENCRNKFWQESPEIAAKEINEARLFWVKQIQTLLVADCKFEKTKTNLGIFADEEEIYRCVGDKTRQVYHLNANILP